MQTEVKGPIFVTKLNEEEIFGSLNIGHLTLTNITSISGKPVFRMESGEEVYCSRAMFERIEKRLTILKNNQS